MGIPGEKGFPGLRGEDGIPVSLLNLLNKEK